MYIICNYFNTPRPIEALLNNDIQICLIIRNRTEVVVTHNNDFTTNFLISIYMFELLNHQQFTKLELI